MAKLAATKAKSTINITTRVMKKLSLLAGLATSNTAQGLHETNKNCHAKIYIHRERDDLQ